MPPLDSRQARRAIPLPTSRRALARLALVALVLGPLVGSAHGAAIVVVDGCRKADTCSYGGPASGNGEADPGETGDLYLQLRNRGNATATRFQVLVSSADPSLEILLDTMPMADLPAGESIETLAIPFRIAPDVACGTTFTLDVTLAYSGTFRSDSCRIDVPVACFPCGADPCHPANIVPWNPGPYGNDLLLTAGDFTLPTLDGDWTFSTAWTGCESVVFVVHHPGWSYSDVLWGSSVLGLLQQTPRNVHYVFMSAAADPAAVTADITDMRTRTDAAIARFPAADQAHWRAHLHHVTTGVPALGNWITDFVAAHGPTAFCIDLFQRVRQTGLFFWVGGPQSPELRFLAHEVRHFNFERERQRQADFETFTEVVVWDSVLMNSGQMDVTFPDAETMARFDTMIFDLSWQCTNPWDSRSCEWDYLANLYLCDPADLTQCGQEFGRWITPYGRGGRWVTDATPYMALIRDGGVRRLSFYTPYQYTMTLKIYFSNRHRGLRPESAAWLHSGGNFEDPAYNANHPPRQIEVPAWVRRAEIAALITGHGFGNNAENCAEFCNHQHRFTINGVSVMQEFPEAQTQYGCVDQIETGTIPNQFGTWHYGRGGWCPGLDVPPFRGDITAGVVPGEVNEVVYEGLFNGAPYTPGPIGNPNGFGARVDMSSYLVFYAESPEDDCTDGIDDDGDGFVDCADQGCESQSACDGFDTDGDGTINADDCDALDPTLAGSPAGRVRVHVVKAGGTPRVVWPDLDAAAGTSTRVDVLTGLITELWADRGYARGTCLAQSARQGVDDPRTVPATPDAHWYILRARNRCGSEPFAPAELQASSPCD